MMKLKQTKKTMRQLISSRKDIEMVAQLGNLQGVIKADNKSNVYVTLLDGEVLTVLNQRVPNQRSYVVIGYLNQKQPLQVLRSLNAFHTPQLPDIGDHNHTLGESSNPTWVRGGQFLEGLISPAESGVAVHHKGGLYQIADAVIPAFEQDIDLSAHIPSDGALFGLLEIDDTGAISVVEGTPVDSRGLLSYADIPAPSGDADKTSLKYAIKLYAGQSRVLQGSDFSSSDIVDLRWSGGSGGGGGGSVESVTGDGVDNTDPDNPVLTFPTASEVPFTPASGIAATNVQDAIVEAKTDAQTYADGLVVGLWDDRGSFDASVNAYPSSGGSGTAGAILKGDAWTISVAGTLPTGQVVEVGDLVRALVDTPGNTQANWAITQNNIGYVAENSANKATTMSGNETSNILYLTAKAIYDWAVGLFVALTGNQTVAGVKTFSSFPITPSSAPTTDYQVANKKYVDDSLVGLTVQETDANDIFRCNPTGVSAWNGTIATLPGGATLTYNDLGGSEASMVPNSTGQLGKMRLYNTTRGNYALISNCVIGTNTITLTANVPAGWATGDVITITSQTVSGGAVSWVDIEITSGNLVGKPAAWIIYQIIAGTAGQAIRIHPFEASFSASKYNAIFAQVSAVQTANFGLLKLVGNVFSVSWQASVTNCTIREAGYIT